MGDVHDDAMNIKSKIRMHPERSVPDEAVEMLDTGRIAHVGFVDEGQPYVIPLIYYYDREEPDAVYIHSGGHGRAINVAASGAPLCITVTQVDALVYGPEASDHSLNYRCVMVFGRGTVIEDMAEKRRLMHAVVNRYFDGKDGPGSVHQFEPVPEQYLANTKLVRVSVDEVSAKARRGGPRAREPEVGGTLPF